MPLLASAKVRPFYAQVELSDPLVSDYLDWGTRETRLASTRHCIAVATRPDEQGSVDVELWVGNDPTGGAHPIWVGEFELTGDRVQFGSFIGRDLVVVPLDPGLYHATVITSPPGVAATHVRFSLTLRKPAVLPADPEESGGDD